MGGGGGMGDLVEVRIFFAQTSGDKIFSPTYNVLRFFFQHYRPREIFFSVLDIFPPGISMQDFFFSQIRLQDICF